jgi:isoleucyl-tRNA synthetase
VAEALADDCAARFGEEEVNVLARIKGAELDRVEVIPPFSATPVPLMLGDHVTTDAGTGCVHTAPAHGQEDFQIGQEYDLEVYNPVGANGVYLPGTPVFEGKHIFKANDEIVEALAAREILLCHRPLHALIPALLAA